MSRPLGPHWFYRPFRSNPCCEWIGSTTPKGYGIVNFDGKTHLVHRAAWESLNETVPEGYFVLHTCDNPKCFKIEHLYLGTNIDNVLDKMKRDRANKMKCPCCNGTGLVKVKGWRKNHNEQTIKRLLNGQKL